MSPTTQLRRIVEDLYIPLRHKTSNIKTVRNQLLWLGALKRHLHRHPTLADMKPATIRAVLRAMNDKGRARSFVDKIERDINAFWRWCQERRYLDNAPERRGFYWARKIPRSHANGRNWSTSATKGEPTPDRYRQRLRPIVNPYMRAEKPADGSAPLWDLFLYYAHRRLRGTSQNTADKFQATLSLLERVIGRKPTIADLTDENVEAVMWAAREKGNSIPTANAHRSKLRALHTFAFRHRLVDGTIDVPKMKAPRRIPQAWTQEQLARLFQECQKQRGDIAGVPASSWLVALLATLYDCGERISAMMQVTWEMINLDTGVLLIPAELRKGKSGDMCYRLHPTTIDLLRAIEKPRRDVVFAWPGCQGKLWYRFKNLLRDAGLPHGRRDKFHKMRRTHASFVMACGGNPQLALGHADAATTRDYLDPTICGGPQPCDIIPRPIIPKLVHVHDTTGSTSQAGK